MGFAEHWSGEPCRNTAAQTKAFVKLTVENLEKLVEDRLEVESRA